MMRDTIDFRDSDSVVSSYLNPELQLMSSSSQCSCGSDVGHFIVCMPSTLLDD